MAAGETKSPIVTGEMLNKAEICPADAGIRLHDFSEKLLDSVVHFHVMRMADSLYIWIGTDSKLGNLALAMQTKFSQMPTGTMILGEPADSPSMSIAQKFAKRTKKQVFLSYNALSSNMLVPLVEARLVQEIKAHPECF